MANAAWVDKYAPKSRGDLIGNSSEYQALCEWLVKWEPRTSSSIGSEFKAVLISGPPGIGKSSMARVACDSLKYTVYELNASDTRSRKLLQQELGDVVHAGVVTFGSKITKPTRAKRCIIMDEVDGMSGSDRGGITELIAIIKSTETPIICICNDEYATSVKSLKNHCLLIKCQRPDIRVISKQIARIARLEKVHIQDDQVENLVRESGNDIRQCINALQFISRGEHSLANRDGKDASHRLSAFSAARLMYVGTADAPLADRFEAFFTDYSMVPMMVAQACPQGIKRGVSPLEALTRLSRASDAACDEDVIETRVRRDQRWDMLPLQGALTVRIASIAGGGIGFPGFPEWLGKNSTCAKSARQLNAMSTQMQFASYGSGIGRRSVRMDYIPAMRDRIVDDLKSGKVEEAVSLADDYALTRDDVFETMSQLNCFSKIKCPLTELPGTTKAAFTRAYNKRDHSSQILAHLSSATIVSKKLGDLSLQDGDGDVEMEEEEEEEETRDEAEAFRVKALKKKQPAQTKVKKAAQASAKTTTAASRKRKNPG